MTEHEYLKAMDSKYARVRWHSHYFDLRKRKPGSHIETAWLLELKDGKAQLVSCGVERDFVWRMRYPDLPSFWTDESDLIG